MIYIRPVGGICNRLRSIASAYSLAKEHGQYIHVFWIVNSEINCEFEKCLYIKEEVKSSISVQNIYDDTETDEIVSLSEVFEEEQEEDFIMKYKENPQKNYYVRSFSEFYPCDMKLFVPAVDINSEIDTLLCNSDMTNIIGIHIRRTDLEIGKKKSPLWLFLFVMILHCMLNHKTKFYIATDDLLERKRIIRIFKNRCIYNEKIVLGRNSEQGIKDGIVDLFALSRCKQIYGTYWSSFSDIAGKLGGGRSYPLYRRSFIQLIYLYLFNVVKNISVLRKH